MRTYRSLAAGRGFAVVAQQVKALAGQTAKATSEISADRRDPERDAGVGLRDDGIGGIIARVSEIAAFARNMRQAAQGTTQLATNIAEVSQGAGATGPASIDVLSWAQLLADESSRLTQEMERFLATVRPASPAHHAHLPRSSCGNHSVSAGIYVTRPSTISIGM